MVKISVVVPAYNEENYLPACLASLKNQKFSGDFEIIVVDNNSSDKTAQIARDFGCKVVFEGQQGVCFARQRGLEEARGEIIVSTDADCIFPEDWLANIEKAFAEDEKIAAVVGPYEFIAKPGIGNIVSQKWFTMVSLVHKLSKKVIYAPAANFAFYKKDIEAVGGYNVKLNLGGDEYDLLKKLKQKGEVLYLKENKIKTSSRRFKNGLLYNLFVFTLSWYLLGYFLNTRLTKKSFFGRYPAIRKEASRKKILLEQTILGCFVLGFLVYFSFFSANSQVFGKVISHENTKQKIIALTFDDGPNEPYTSEILDILDKYNIKATFFEVGKNIERYSTTTERIFQEGHVVGNHSFSHSFKKNFSHPFFKDEIEKTQDIVFKITGKRPVLFRPPWLFRDPLTMKTAKEHGLVVITGKFASNAEGAQHKNELNIDEISEQVKPGRILVFHDGYNSKGADRTQTVKAIERLVPRLLQEGYVFVTVPELLEIQPYQ